MTDDFHTTESRDFPNVTPLQLAPITCGRSLSPARLSRINLVAGRLLRYPIVTHLLDDAGECLCCVQDSPTAQAPALLHGTCAADVRYFGSCSPTALVPIIQSIQARCDSAPIRVSTRTPICTALGGAVVSVRPELCVLRGRGASRRTKSLITRTCDYFYIYIHTLAPYLTPHNALAKRSAKCSNAYLTPYRKRGSECIEKTSQQTPRAQDRQPHN